MSDQAASINFDRIAPIYEESRGGLGSEAGRLRAGDRAHLRPGPCSRSASARARWRSPSTDAGTPSSASTSRRTCSPPPTSGWALVSRIARRDGAADRDRIGARTSSRSGCSSSSAASRHAARGRERPLRGRLIVIPSRAIHEPDDIDAVAVDFNAVFRGRAPTIPQRLIALGEWRGSILPVTGRDTQSLGRVARRDHPADRDTATSASSSTSATRLETRRRPRDRRVCVTPRPGSASHTSRAPRRARVRSGLTYSAIAIACAVRSVWVSERRHSVTPRSPRARPPSRAAPRGGAERAPHHLDVAERELPQPDAQRLHHRLLGPEPRREARRDRCGARA